MQIWQRWWQPHRREDEKRLHNPYIHTNITKSITRKLNSNLISNYIWLLFENLLLVRFGIEFIRYTLEGHWRRHSSVTCKQKWNSNVTTNSEQHIINFTKSTHCSQSRIGSQTLAPLWTSQYPIVTKSSHCKGASPKLRHWAVITVPLILSKRKCLLVLTLLHTSMPWKCRKCISTYSAKHYSYYWWRWCMQAEQLNGYFNFRAYTTTNPCNLQRTPSSALRSSTQASFDQETKDMKLSL